MGFSRKVMEKKEREKEVINAQKKERKKERLL